MSTLYFILNVSAHMHTRHTMLVINHYWKCTLKSICVEFNPGSYVVNYGFIYALCGGQVCLGLLHDF